MGVVYLHLEALSVGTVLEDTSDPKFGLRYIWLVRSSGIYIQHSLKNILHCKYLLRSKEIKQSNLLSIKLLKWLMFK